MGQLSDPKTYLNLFLLSWRQLLFAFLQDARLAESVLFYEGDPIFA